MISDLLMMGIVKLKGIDRNNKMVIKPLGAININGNKGMRINNKKIARKIKMADVIHIAHKAVSELNNSSVCIKKPKTRKNMARIRNVISEMMGRNLCCIENLAIPAHRPSFEQQQGITIEQQAARGGNAVIQARIDLQALAT